MDKFTVFYDDESHFSGNPLKRDWNKIDSTKKIIKLEYNLGNILIIMEGYKQYNHTKERLGMGRNGIGRILLMGRTNGDTEIIIIDLIKKKIGKQLKPCYEEYGKQILAGWQEGKLNNPKSTFKKL